MDHAHVHVRVCQHDVFPLSLVAVPALHVQLLEHEPFTRHHPQSHGHVQQFSVQLHILSQQKGAGELGHAQYTVAFHASVVLLSVFVLTDKLTVQMVFIVNENEPATGLFSDHHHGQASLEYHAQLDELLHHGHDAEK